MLNPGHCGTTEFKITSIQFSSDQIRSGRFFLHDLQLFFEFLDFLFYLFDLAGNFGCGYTAFGCEQCFAAIDTAAPARVFRFELRCVGLVNDQAIVVVELFSSLDVAKGFDEDAVVLLIGFAVRVAAVIDPPGGVAAMQSINHLVFVHMKIEGVVGVRWVMGVAILRFIPTDDFTDILVQGLAFGDV